MLSVKTTSFFSQCEEYLNTHKNLFPLKL